MCACVCSVWCQPHTLARCHRGARVLEGCSRLDGSTCRARDLDTALRYTAAPPLGFAGRFAAAAGASPVDEMAAARFRLGLAAATPTIAALVAEVAACARSA